MVKKLLVISILLTLVLSMSTVASAFEIGQVFWSAEGSFSSEEKDLFEKGTKEFYVISGQLIGLGPISVGGSGQFSTDSDITAIIGQNVEELEDSLLMGDVGVNIRFKLPATLFNITGHASAGYTVKGFANATDGSLDYVFYRGAEFEGEISRNIFAGLDILIGAKVAPSLSGTRKHVLEDIEVNPTATANRYNVGLRFRLPLFSFEGGYMYSSLIESNVDDPYTAEYSGIYFGGRFGF